MAKADKMSLIRFQREFNSEEICESYLLNKRWPNGFRCPHCEHDQYYYVQKRKLYECRQCGTQTSVTAGTIMHKTKLPLLKWFWAIYLVVHDKRGRSALSLADLLEVNYRTAWRMLHKIRRAMSEQDANYQLSGFVEMDDAYFGSPKKGKDGRGTTKAKVAVALSTDEEGRPRFLRMQVIDKVTIEEIHRVAKSCIAKGSTILSDGHSSYKQLKNIGYQHISKTYYKEDNEEFLKWLHTIISNAKAFVDGTYHGLGQKHLQAYLDEFCYRFNRRFFPNELFGRLLNACVSASPFIIPESCA
jgi:transposase-like protein